VPWSVHDESMMIKEQMSKTIKVMIMIMVPKDLISVKRDLISAKRDLISVERDLICVKRDLSRVKRAQTDQRADMKDDQREDQSIEIARTPTQADKLK